MDTKVEARQAWNVGKSNMPYFRAVAPTLSQHALTCSKTLYIPHPSGIYLRGCTGWLNVTQWDVTWGHSNEYQTT